MTFWDIVFNYKTRVLGLVTAVLGFIQAYPGLSDMISPTVYAWVMFLIGILVTICGFLNASVSTESPKE